MDVVAKMDEMGRPAWIVAMILGFVFFWPVGLAILAYLIWSRRMGCMHHGMSGEAREQWRARKEEWRARKREWRQEMHNRFHGGPAGMRSSGNSAFDDYKAETIRRLEEEQDEFNAFLDHLRKSKDKAEFDQFMAGRRNRPDAGEGNASESQPPAPSY